ncbi:hypothetical protein [Jiangella rhizosphaerae]|uniref:hypothetical protein n=1 Tax=Jiangella rhizosphaerae TaxID=2293569 RepID=UPI0011C4A35C|nr:hypothetical protein [Jiangella rhizosphaerae]
MQTLQVGERLLRIDQPSGHFPEPRQLLDDLTERTRRLPRGASGILGQELTTGLTRQLGREPTATRPRSGHVWAVARRKRL